jgi:hypothetical protein
VWVLEILSKNLKSFLVTANAVFSRKERQKTAHTIFSTPMEIFLSTAKQKEARQWLA